MPTINGATFSSALGFDGTASAWNWAENYVQQDEGTDTAGSFIASESTLVGCGFPQMTNQMNIIKLGLTPSISINQNIPQQRLYEIGSVRCHIINGIPQGGLSINRLIYNGPSLMRALYGAVYDESGNLKTDPTVPNQKLMSITNVATKDRIGQYNQQTNLWLSMWDTRFKKPFGLAIFMQDISSRSAGGLYFEGCKVGSHQFGQSAGQMIMMEGISVQFDRSVPIIGGIGLPS